MQISMQYIYIIYVQSVLMSDKVARSNNNIIIPDINAVLMVSVRHTFRHSHTPSRGRLTRKRRKKTTNYTCRLRNYINVHTHEYVYFIQGNSFGKQRSLFHKILNFSKYFSYVILSQCRTTFFNIFFITCNHYVF